MQCYILDFSVVFDIYLVLLVLIRFFGHNTNNTNYKQCKKYNNKSVKFIGLLKYFNYIKSVQLDFCLRLLELERLLYLHTSRDTGAQACKRDKL